MSLSPTSRYMAEKSIQVAMSGQQRESTPGSHLLQPPCKHRQCCKTSGWLINVLPGVLYAENKARGCTSPQPRLCCRLC